MRLFSFYFVYFDHVCICSNTNIRTVLLLEKTMGKLQAVLDGYENVEVVPSLFVFMGNFCSHPCNLAFNSFSSLR